jgi:hypothetical protein
MPGWASSRRRNLRRTCGSLTNPAGMMFIALLVITGTLTWLLIRGGSNISSPLSQLPDSPTTPMDIPKIHPKQNSTVVAHTNHPKANSTLNFQQIFAINLPARLDRKDLLTVMAKYTNLSITIVPGIRSLAENAIPPPRNPGSPRMEEYAVWRAHANVWRKIMEDGLTTALILEDDNDWDINLKEQIPRIMDALEEIRAVSQVDDGEGVVRGSPEIEAWDMLYLGSCWESPTISDRRGRKPVVSIPLDHENVASHNYNWVIYHME